MSVTAEEVVMNRLRWMYLLGGSLVLVACAHPRDPQGSDDQIDVRLLQVGSNGFDAGAGGGSDAGSGSGGFDAGSVGFDAGSGGGSDAGSVGFDAGSGGFDAGSGGGSDAGSVGFDAGSGGGSDAGSGGFDAGIGGGSDAGSGRVEEAADGVASCTDGDCDCPSTGPELLDETLIAHALHQPTTVQLPEVAVLAGWACEYQNEPGWRQMCLDFLNLGAATDPYSFREERAQPTATIFDTARVGVNLSAAAFTTVARLSYYWVGHSGTSRGVPFINFAAAAIPKAAAATLYHFTNSGCTTFNLMNYQALKTAVTTSIRPLVRNLGKTAIICGNQMTTPVNDLVLDVTATGSGIVLTNTKKTRVCFSIGDAGTLSQYVASPCNIGGSCSLSSAAGASAYAYCASMGAWACERCRNPGTGFVYETRPIAECNTAAGE
jgi:hypothetical protein